MMKKAIWALVALCSVAWTAWGQQDPEARRVLDAMSNKYRQASSFSATLTQSLDNEAQGLHEQMQGSILVKGEKYLVKLGAQEFANNGEKMYVYLEEIDEINIDYYEEDAAMLSPSKIFDIYKSGYKYMKLADETVNGKACHVIDLIPENTGSNQIYRIRLVVRKNDLMVHRYEMYDRGNTVYTFIFSDLKMNVPASDAMFQFDKNTHPGAYINDLTKN